MTDLSKTLRELAGRATRGPFMAYGEPEVNLPYSLFAGTPMVSWFAPVEPLQGYDLDLVVLLLNNLPAILTALELQERVNAAGGYMLTQGNPLMPQSGSAATLKGDQ